MAPVSSGGAAAAAAAATATASDTLGERAHPTKAATDGTPEDGSCGAAAADGASVWEEEGDSVLLVGVGVGACTAGEGSATAAAAAEAASK